MSLILTYWEDPPNGQKSPDDFDEILEIHLKSVKQIPELVAARPLNCTMISTEYSANHTKNGKITNPDNPRRFKEIWRKGQPVPRSRGLVKCRLCKQLIQTVVGV